MSGRAATRPRATIATAGALVLVVLAGAGGAVAYDVLVPPHGQEILEDDAGLLVVLTEHRWLADVVYVERWEDGRTIGRSLLPGPGWLYGTDPRHAIIALGDALKRYEGTAFVVSHDRDLISTFADRLFAFTPFGLIDFAGSYDEYLEKHGDDYLKARLGAKSALK